MYLVLLFCHEKENKIHEKKLRIHEITKLNTVHVYKKTKFCFKIRKFWKTTWIFCFCHQSKILQFHVGYLVQLLHHKKNSSSFINVFICVVFYRRTKLNMYEITKFSENSKSMIVFLELFCTNKLDNECIHWFQ